MALMRCKCGGIFEKLPELDGMYCNKCNEYTDITIVDGVDADLNKIYDPERVKQFRGTPMNEITYGTDGKGKVKVIYPSFCTEDEIKYLIDKEINNLKYLLDKCKDLGLDIGSKKT